MVKCITVAVGVFAETILSTASFIIRNWKNGPPSRVRSNFAFAGSSAPSTTVVVSDFAKPPHDCPTDGS
ncbi:unannotated protein [freshwater metagenome]|uniref:Unannotated protein n=1 Tax=freshwater metagenome TaxID=449393 RepID=A0A6J7TL67_9ZZZZ